MYALAGSALTAASSLLALIISKIKCRRVIDEDGQADAFAVAVESDHAFFASPLVGRI